MRDFNGVHFTEISPTSSDFLPECSEKINYSNKNSRIILTLLLHILATSSRPFNDINNSDEMI